MPALQKKSYNTFIIPIEKTDYMSVDYYRGIMFVCNGTQIYRINPTTNKVMGVTDLEITNPVIDIDMENQSFFYGICLGEKKIKKFDTYTGKVVSELVVDRFQSDAMVPFKLLSAMTKAPDGFYFIDGFFDSTAKTNRIVKYNPTSKISTVIRTIPAANFNDLEFDDIGLLRLTDVAGVIERYNIIPSSPDYGKQIDQIPVGDPFPLNETIINPPSADLIPGQIAPPDITYFLEQPFAAITLEPNWEFKTCPNPQEWQLALNPCINPIEQNINFIKDSSYVSSQPLQFVDQVVINSDTIEITLDSSLNYENVRVGLTNFGQGVQGNAVRVGNLITFTLKNLLGDRATTSSSFNLGEKYQLEVAVVLDSDLISQTYHSFLLNFEPLVFPTTLVAPFTQPTPLTSVGTIDLSSQNFSQFPLSTSQPNPSQGPSLILDAMEQDQEDSYQVRQEILFLQGERDSLLKTKAQAQTLKDYKADRKTLLNNYDTTQFPYSYQLAHIDQVISEYSTILGSNTLNKINKKIAQIDDRIQLLENYVLNLEEILRQAEFPCRTPRLFAIQFDINASEEYQATAGQTHFSFANASYNPGQGDLKVFVNGVEKVAGSDYTETDSTSIDFLSGLAQDDIVTFVFYPTLQDPNIVIPSNGPTLVADPVINRVDFPEVWDVAVGVQSPLHLDEFKVYDAFDRQLDLNDLDPFYFELPDNNVVELRVVDSVYYLFGLQDGTAELILHAAHTSFKIPLNIQTGITPTAFFTPANCHTVSKKQNYLWSLVLEDLTLCLDSPSETYHQPQPESHLVIQGITDTGTRKVEPGEWALILEGTVVLPTVYDQGIVLEYAQIDQDTEVNSYGYSLVLSPETHVELPIILEGALDSDTIIAGPNPLILSPTAFREDLILEQSLEFDPAEPLDNPLIIQQGGFGNVQGGPLQIQFICQDVPADDSENIILLQGNTGGRRPTKITWDGDYCYVLYANECTAQLIDLKSIFRKVFISSPDPEIYGIGLHSTNIFAQARDLEGQEFALAKTKSKAISFVNTFSEYLNSQNTNSTSSTPQITVTTTGSIYGPPAVTLDQGVIFNYNNESGITLAPGQYINLSFNTFKLLEGATYLARTESPLQEIIIETSSDGINFIESDNTFISKTNLAVYELNQFSAGVEFNKITTNIRFKAADTNTSSVDIALVNLFYEKDRFSRNTLPLQQVGAVSSQSLIIANQSGNQPLDFVFSPDPLNFTSQTVAAPINPLISSPLKSVLESSALAVSGIPSSGLLPTIFSESEFSAISPVSPITDIRGNSELIYRSGLMFPFTNKILNSDWNWGLLNWDIVGKPVISFSSLLSDTLSNQLIVTRNIDSQDQKSGITSKPISVLPGTDYYVTFEGIDPTGLGAVRLDYYDVRGDFISSSAPIPLADTMTIVSSKKTTPDFTQAIKVSVFLDGRTSTNSTATPDIINMNWICLTEEAITDFTPYENNLDVIKIAIET